MKKPGKQKQSDRERDLARGAFLFRVTEDILVAMEDCGVTKAELAQRLGKSKARISQLLSGDTNMTIGTLADIAFALGLTPDKTFREYSDQRERITDQSAALPLKGRRRVSKGMTGSVLGKQLLKSVKEMKAGKVARTTQIASNAESNK